MMSVYGCKTKKDLKSMVGEPPPFVETCMFGKEYKGDGDYCVWGRRLRSGRWYARVVVAGGVIKHVS